MPSGRVLLCVLARARRVLVVMAISSLPRDTRHSGTQSTARRYHSTPV
jgi:hypothetical protein